MKIVIIRLFSSPDMDVVLHKKIFHYNKKWRIPIFSKEDELHIKNNVPARVGGRHPDNPLQQARINAGVSQEQIAEWLSCETRTIQRYEAGEQYPTQNMLLKMAECYHCRLDDLFPTAYNTSNSEKQIHSSSNSDPDLGCEIPIIYPQLFWNMFFDLLSFRRPMAVAELLIYSDGSGAYNCPRCNNSIDREFADFCECCGQHLSWKSYKKAKIIHIGQQDSTHS